MVTGGAPARWAILLAAAGAACNGQFDFDTALPDAGEPPIIVVDAAMSDMARDAMADLPGTGVHIACGATDCASPGCCTTSAGQSCVDIAEGGTCGGLLIQCDDTEDCPLGQVCCAEGNDLLPACTAGQDCRPNPSLQRVHCEPETHCRTSSYVILCNPDRPSPCAQCVASSLAGLPPGYHQCAATP
jgi:hypothetical protein